MRGRWFFALLIPGCATAGESDAIIPRADSRVDAAAEVADTRVTDSTVGADSSGDSIFPVEDTGVDTAPVDTGPPPGPCAVPKGSTVTASGSYSSTPDLVIDGKTETYWNSGGYSGWIKITFPSPTRLDRIRIAGLATPPCSETYTLTGHRGGTDVALGAVTRSVGGGGWLDPPVEVARDEYDALTVSVGTAASWIAVGEIATSDSYAKCP